MFALGMCTYALGMCTYALGMCTYAFETAGLGVAFSVGC